MQVDNTPDIYIVLQGDEAQLHGLSFVETLRDQLPDINIQTNSGGGAFKGQIKKADKSGAKIALIIGDDEVANNTVSIKLLREKAEQITVAQTELVTTINKFL